MHNGTGRARKSIRRRVRGATSVAQYCAPYKRRILARRYGALVPKLAGGLAGVHSQLPSLGGARLSCHPCMAGEGKNFKLGRCKAEPKPELGEEIVDMPCNITCVQR